MQAVRRPGGWGTGGVLQAWLNHVSEKENACLTKQGGAACRLSMYAEKGLPTRPKGRNLRPSTVHAAKKARAEGGLGGMSLSPAQYLGPGRLAFG